MTARYTCVNCGFQTAILAESLEHQDGRCPKAKKLGVCVWFTGLPASGKTTLAGALQTKLTGRGVVASILDGDELRREVCADLGFSKEDRDEQVRRVGVLARELIEQGQMAIVALVSPYREARTKALQHIGRAVLVWVSCPKTVCMARDPKGLWAQAASGEITGFTGWDDPYEIPEPWERGVWAPTDANTIEKNIAKIVKVLEERGYTG